VSFVSRAEEITAVRAACPDALVVAKIERVAALENLEELLDASDGVMVARGDLGSRWSSSSSRWCRRP
jgi:pyruvate kinase